MTQRVKVISNVSLTIPYEELVSLEQIVYAAEHNREYDDEHDTLTVTLVLGDEFSVQMNSRNFKANIDPLFFNTVLTCRHYYISLYYTAQRFGHVDALLRQVTSCVVRRRTTLAHYSHFSWYRRSYFYSVNREADLIPLVPPAGDNFNKYLFTPSPSRGSLLP